MLGNAEASTLGANLIIHYDVTDVIDQATKRIRILGTV
jgi:hypothetical protein